MASINLHRVLMALAIVVASCSGGGGDSNAPPTAALEAPQSVVVDNSLCERPHSEAQGLLGYGMLQGQCVRRFFGLTPSTAGSNQRERPLATTPTQIIGIDALFDWAELTFPQYFPSARTSAVLGPYTYRFYPETQNHVAVSGDVVYIQGPLSGGPLQVVGTLAEFTCLADPTLCGEAPADCDAVTAWTVGGTTCNPNAGQATRIVSGTNFTFTDSSGTTTGSATYACNNGVLSPIGTATCVQTAPLRCDTSGLSWSVGEASCSPNASSPTSLASGTEFAFVDSDGTTGRASYSCTNGVLKALGAPTCVVPEPPKPLDCAVSSDRWTVDQNQCVADAFSTVLAHGTSVTLVDTTGGVTGNISYACSNGTLTVTGTPVCIVEPQRITDSFGGDGGTADGGANGDGTAGDGKAIVGGIVSAVDTKGTVVFADKPTDENGYFRLKLTGMVPPLVVSVKRTDGVVRHSISTQALKTNGYIFIAVTGITDKMASDIAVAAGFNSAAALTPKIVADNPDAVTAALNAVRNNAIINPALGAAGIDAATFDPLTTPFRPDGTGYDAVLDDIVVTTDSNGTTIIQTAACDAPLSWTVGNFTCVPDAGQALTIESYTSVIFKDTIGSPTGTVSFGCVQGVLQPPVLPNCKP